jgi:hypothetical protein
MKKLFIASLLAGLLTSFAVPALTQDNGPIVQDPNVCDVSFDVDVLKQKRIRSDKAVIKTIYYTFGSPDTWFSVFPLQLAEVEAFKCDLLADNVINVSGFISASSILSSFNNFIGVAQVNQTVGLLNNQGNVLAAGITDISGEAAFSMVDAAVEKTIVQNKVTVSDSVFLDRINLSFNTFVGLAQINQSAGLLNNQNNVVALGTNFDTMGLLAENDTFLSMQNVSNKAKVVPLSGLSAATTTKVSTDGDVNNSFNGYIGIAQLNQAPGFLNNQANIVSIAYAGRQNQPNFSQ